MYRIFSTQLSYLKKDIMKENYPVELIIYGRLELMLMKYCPLKQCLNYCSNCKTSTDKFYLENNEKERYPIIRILCWRYFMKYLTFAIIYALIFTIVRPIIRKATYALLGWEK